MMGGFFAAWVDWGWLWWITGVVGAAVAITWNDQ